MRFPEGSTVWKHGAGYSGPGVVRAVFTGWDGLPRYVVAHRVHGGNGEFYHIYSESNLMPYNDNSLLTEQYARKTHVEKPDDP